MNNWEIPCLFIQIQRSFKLSYFAQNQKKIDSLYFFNCNKTLDMHENIIIFPIIFSKIR